MDFACLAQPTAVCGGRSTRSVWVQIGLVTFIDESYNKKHMSCESIYGERHNFENLMTTKVQSKDCSAPQRR